MNTTKTEKSMPALLKQNDMQLNWEQLADKRGTQFGSLRAVYNGLEGTNFRCHKVLLVVGQASPPHDATAEHIIYQLQGHVRFDIAGESYSLAPGDMFFIPANTQYRYENVGDDNAFFLSTLGRVDDQWPASGHYVFDGADQR